MKNLLLLTCLFALYYSNTQAQIVVQNTQTPAEIVINELLGNGITAFNITYNGSAVDANSVQPNVTKFLANGTTFPYSGVLLTNGAGSVAIGPNNSGSETDQGTTQNISDADMDAITTNTTTNGVVLEFDFQATGDTLSFDYIFASEEYPDDWGGGFYDVFGFFLSGPGINGPFSNNGVNIATLPLSTTAISIPNVNETVNSAYYLSNEGGLTYGNAIQYDGSTVTLTASSQLVCGATYHIKMGICNVGDESYDSGVFLKGNSFASNVISVASASSNVESFTDTLLAEACTSTDILFVRPLSGIDTVNVFHFEISGTADMADFQPFGDSVIFAIGEDSVFFTLNPIADAIVEPMEYIQIKTFNVTECGDTLTDSLRIYVVDYYELTYDLIDEVTTNCSTQNPSVTVSNFQNSISPYSYLWSDLSTANPATFTNTGINEDSVYFYVAVTDGCGNEFPDSVLMINDYQASQFQLMPNDTIYNTCPTNVSVVTANLVSGNFPPFTYNWTNGSSVASANLTNAGADGSELEYFVTITNACGLSTTDSVLIINAFAATTFEILEGTPLYNTCAGNTVAATLSELTNPAAPYTYDWSDGSSAVSANLTNAGANGSEQVYTVTITNACGMTSSNTVSVINDFPTTTFEILPSNTLTNTCAGSTVAATASVLADPAGPYTYDWSDGSSAATANLTNAGANGTQQVYTLTITNACGMSSTNTVSVTNDFPISEFEILPNDTLYNTCPTNTLTATATFVSTPAGPYTYLWSEGTSTADVNLTNPGADGAELLFTVTITNACSMSTTNSVLVINDYQTLAGELSPAGSQDINCLLGTVSASVTASAGNAPYTYLWNDGTSGTGISITDTEGINGESIPYSVVITDACGFTTTINGEAIVNQTLEATLSSTAASSCINDGTVSAAISGSTGTELYEWTGPGSASANTVNTQNYSDIASGWYYFTVTDDICIYEDSIEVDQLISPLAIINANDVKATSPATIVFTNTSQNATEYTWDFGNGTSTTSQDLSSQGTIYSESGIYTVLLTAISGPCMDTASISIEIIDKPEIVNIPTVFSPNGDGVNDFFYITVKDAQEIELIIQNRWGNVVFSETGTNVMWDGADVGEGTYFYQYKATGYNDDVIEGQGFFHVSGN